MSTPDLATLGRHESWEGVRVTVAGLGVSGFAAADNLTHLGARVTALDESDAATIKGRIMELKQAIDGGDAAEIRSKTDALQEASHKLAEAVYAKATADAAGNKSTSQQAADHADEVIEEAEIVE